VTRLFNKIKGGVSNGYDDTPPFVLPPFGNVSIRQILEVGHEIKHTVVFPKTSNVFLKTSNVF